MAEETEDVVIEEGVESTESSTTEETRNIDPFLIDVDLAYQYSIIESLEGKGAADEFKKKTLSAIQPIVDSAIENEGGDEVEDKKLPGASAKPAAPAAKPAAPAAKPAPKPAAGKQAPAKPAAAAGKDKVKKDEVDSPFIDTTKPKAKTVYATLEEVNPVVKEKFGLTDVNTLMTSAEKWKADSTKLPGVEEELNTMKEAFRGLPPELALAAQKFYKGQDYLEDLTKMASSVNYGKKFEDNDISKVLLEMDPDLNLTNKEGEDYLDVANTKLPAVKTTIAAAKKYFDTKQKSINDERTRIATVAQQSAASVTKSITESVKSFSESFPKIERAQIQKIEQLLKSDNIEGQLLTDKDGRYTSEGVERVYWALFGKELYMKLGTAYSSVKEEYEALLDKGSPDTDRVTKRIPSGKPDEEVERIRTYVPEKKSVYSVKEIKN